MEELPFVNEINFLANKIIRLVFSWDDLILPNKDWKDKRNLREKNNEWRFLFQSIEPDFIFETDWFYDGTCTSIFNFNMYFSLLLTIADIISISLFIHPLLRLILIPLTSTF